MKEQIIHLDRHDDFHSARDKIGWAQADRVLLVWPQARRGRSVPVLNRKLDLVLLQRHAARLGARLALITADDAVADHAAEVGLPVFDSVQDSHLFIWRSRSPQNHNFSLAERRFPRPAPEETEPLIEWRRPRWLGNPGLRYLGRSLAFAVAVATVAFMLALSVPGAEITLVPNVQHITAPLVIVADPALDTLDYAGRRIPAYTEEAEVSGTTQVATTGSVDQATQRAQGTVTFTNLTDLPVRVPAGTAVRTTGSVPIRFVTQQDATLEDAQGATAEVPLLAVEPGPAGNVGPGLINDVEGPLGVQVAVVNLHATGGGEVAQVPAVTDADRKQALEQLQTELRQQGYAEILANLQPGEFSPLETVRLAKITGSTFDHFVGEQTDVLTLEMHAVVVASVVDEALAFEIGQFELEQRAATALALLPDSVVFERGATLAATEEGRVDFEIAAQGDAGPIIDEAVVRETVRWQPVTQAGARLHTEFPVVQPPTLTVWPEWFPRIPWLGWRIDVTIAANANPGG